MKISYNKLRDILTASTQIPGKDKDGEAINDRLTYAIKRFSDKNKRRIAEFQELEIDIMRDHASLDDKGNFILLDGDKLSYTKENQKKLTVALKKFMDAGEIEIEPYVCTELTRSKNLPLWVQMDLDGFILTADPEFKQFEITE